MHLRLVDWNCHGLYRQKAGYILKAEPDIAIIQGCEKNHGQPFQNLWFGDDVDNGIGVFATNDYKLTIHPSYNPEFKYIIPVKVTGKDEFNLIVVWIMSGNDFGKLPIALDYYKSLLKESTIAVGDFCCVLGKPIPILGKYGIKSVYHRLHKEKFGKESFPTLFDLADLSNNYHTDYCFASEKLKVEKMGITAPQEWLELSNQMALIVDFGV